MSGHSLSVKCKLSFVVYFVKESNISEIV